MPDQIQIRKKDKSCVLVQSRTRLYTNFYIGEHKEEYVVKACKMGIKNLFENIKSSLSDDDFIEGILAGASIAMLGFYPNIDSHRKVDIKLLGSHYLKWLKSIFHNPARYMKLAYIVEDIDGSLAIDMLTSVSVSPDSYKLIMDEDVNVSISRINALYNVIAAAKYRIFKKLQSLLATNPGLLIDDICDVYTVEHCLADNISSDTNRISKIVRPVNSLESIVKTIWSAKLSVFIS